MDRKLIVGMLQDWGIALAIVFAMLVLWSAFQPGVPTAGTAPDFLVLDEQDRPTRLADLKEPVILLNFWATWCGPCRAEIPELADFAKAHPEVGVYGISTDDNFTVPRLLAVARKFGISYRVLYDNKLNAEAAYGVNAIPVTFVLDEHRHIQTVIQGATTRRALEQALAKAHHE